MAVPISPRGTWTLVEDTGEELGSMWYPGVDMEPQEPQVTWVCKDREAPEGWR